MNNVINSEICVIGTGPAGLGCLLSLLDKKKLNKIIAIDAGPKHDYRFCNILTKGDCVHHEHCNVISGFGGCFFMGGGKISMFPAGTGLINIIKNTNYLDESLNLFKQYFDIKKVEIKDENYSKRYFLKKGYEYKYYDVYHCSNLNKSYDSLYELFISNGIKMYFNTNLIKIEKLNKIFKLTCSYENKLVYIYTQILVLAIGRKGKNILNNIYITSH